MAPWTRQAAPSLPPRRPGRLGCFIALPLSPRGRGIASEAYLQMIWGGLGDIPSFLATGDWSVLTRAWGESATKAALLTFTGLAVSAAFCVGLFNIGAQGQMTVGAISAAVIGAKLNLPPGLHPIAGIARAAIAGALYALLAAVLK